MFKQLLSVFKKDSLMNRAYQRSFDMISITHNMFLMAKKSLRHTEDSQVDIDIYDKDIEVNKFEREVRRNVLNHLILSGESELPSGLVLVSIIIDIERIGDYTKNMIELAMNHPHRLEGGPFEEELQKVEKAVSEHFQHARTCFEKSDKELALKLLKEYEWVNRLCDDNVLKLVKITESDMAPGEAVSLSLYFRWLKRINSHLRNIVTSVANPFDRIGFKPKQQS